MRVPSTGRGLMPRIDSTTYAAWPLDHTDAGPATDLVLNQKPLPTLGGTPATALGAVNRARTFNGTAIYSGGAVAADPTWAQSSWTVTQWLRMTTLPVTPGVPTTESSVVTAALGGRNAVDGGTADDNVQFAFEVVARNDVAVNPNQEVRLRLMWENGAAGTDVLATVTTLDLRQYLGQWIMVTWVKEAAGGGLFNYSCAVNGRFVQPFPALANTTSGAVVNLRWTIGGVRDSAGTGVARVMSGQCCGLVAYTGATQEALLAQDYRRGCQQESPSALHYRAQIRDGGGVLRDLTDPTTVGEDFFREATIIGAIDNQTESMDLVLAREAGELSLAPLKGDSRINNPTLAGSFVPLIDVWREVILSYARVPCWLSPVSSDYQERFRGRVDSLDDGGEALVLHCRDQGVRLAQRWISAEVVYPVVFGGPCGPSAQSREVVLSRILTDNGGLATLYTPVSPNSCMVAMQQPLPRGFLLAALQNIADGIGWKVDFSRWDPLTLAYRLTFRDPQRTKVAPDSCLSYREVLVMDRGELGAENVRNRITGTCADSATLSSEGQYLPTTLSVDDVVSQGLYDLREMELIEDASSQINTTGELSKMITAILADLGRPRREVGFTVPALPELDIGDLVYWDADGLRTTLPQEGAVRSVTHRLSRDGAQTTFTAEGKPASGYSRWLSLEAGRNGRPAIRNPGEALSGRGIGTLLPALTALVDRSNYLGGTKFIEVKNGDFARFTRGNAYPPDAWTPTGAGAVWGTNLSVVTSTSLSGGRAVLLTSATAGLVSQLIPVLGDIDTPYSFEFVWRWPTPPALPVAPKRLDLFVEWIAGDKTTVVGSNVLRPQAAFFQPDDVALIGNTWFTSRVDGVPPTLLGTARFVRITIRASTNALQTMPTGGILVDTVSVYRTAREDRTFHLNAYPYGAACNDLWCATRLRGSGASPVFRTHDWGHNHYITDTATGFLSIAREDGSIELIGPAGAYGTGFYAKEAGTYLVTASVALYTPVASPVTTHSPQIRIVRNATYVDNATQPTNTGGTVVAQASGGTWVSAPRFNPLILAGAISTATISCRSYLATGERLSLEFFRAFQSGGTGGAIVPLGGATDGSENNTWWNVRLGLVE